MLDPFLNEISPVSRIVKFCKQIFLKFIEMLSLTIGIIDYSFMIYHAYFI